MESNDQVKTFKEKISEINDKALKDQQVGKEKARKEAEKDEESQTISFGDVLLDGIINLTTNIASNPQFMDVINKLITDCNIPKQTMQYLMTFTNMIVSQVVYSSILLYDDLLKDEIQKQFEHVAKHINLSKSDIEALKAVIQIHSKDLASIKESLEINKFKKENGIN